MKAMQEKRTVSKNVNSKLRAKTSDNQTGFRLISLYMGSFECFKQQIMNFCSDYYTRFEDTDDGLRLKVKHKQVLPDNFFS